MVFFFLNFAKSTSAKSNLRIATRLENSEKSLECLETAFLSSAVAEDSNSVIKGLVD